MSVYDIADHPDFRFRTTDIVIRIGNTEDGALPKEDEVVCSLLWDCSFCLGSGCSPSHCHQGPSGAETRKAAPRMAGMAYLRDREPTHLKASGFLDPGS